MISSPSLPPYIIEYVAKTFLQVRNKKPAVRNEKIYKNVNRLSARQKLAAQ